MRRKVSSIQILLLMGMLGASLAYADGSSVTEIDKVIAMALRAIIVYMPEIQISQLMLPAVTYSYDQMSANTSEYYLVEFPCASSNSMNRTSKESIDVRLPFRWPICKSDVKKTRYKIQHYPEHYDRNESSFSEAVETVGVNLLELSKAETTTLDKIFMLKTFDHKKITAFAEMMISNYIPEIRIDQLALASIGYVGSGEGADDLGGVSFWSKDGLNETIVDGKPRLQGTGVKVTIYRTYEGLYRCSVSCAEEIMDITKDGYIKVTSSRGIEGKRRNFRIPFGEGVLGKKIDDLWTWIDGTNATPTQAGATNTVSKVESQPPE